jgi:GR25 family glycosyltransferase involved in LPS biosynthesis
MINAEKTYLVHYTKLEDRKKHTDEQFKNLGIDIEYITEYDQEDLTDELIDKHYDSSEESYNSKIHPTYGNRSTPHRILNKGEISCVFKHKLAIEKISKECDNYGVVFEDDVVFVEDFIEKFNKFLDLTPDDWDAIFIGSCAGLRVNPQFVKEDVFTYKVDHPASKGGDSYLLKRDLAEKISGTMDKFVTAADWELSYQFKLHNANVYWWEPPLVVQGSEIGLYKSTLR